MTDYASRTGSTNTKRIEEPYTDQDAVGSLNGTLNLRTGELQPYNRESYVTRVLKHDTSPTPSVRNFYNF